MSLEERCVIDIDLVRKVVRDGGWVAGYGHVVANLQPLAYETKVEVSPIDIVHAVEAMRRYVLEGRKILESSDASEVQFVLNKEHIKLQSEYGRSNPGLQMMLRKNGDSIYGRWFFRWDQKEHECLQFDVKSDVQQTRGYREEDGRIIPITSSTRTSD